MTNEEAIGILALVVETAKGRCFVTDEAISDAYERAINALTRQTALKEKCLVCEHCDRCDSELANHSPKVNSDSGDPISRRDAIECLEHLSACDEPFEEIGTDDETFIGKYEAITGISDLPPAQPAPISEAYAKAVFTWLLDYQIKAAELKGRYTPYEVLSWVANDWRKEHEGSD